MSPTHAGRVRPMMRLVAPKLFPRYPFEEAYFLPYARQFRAALDLPLILLGGVNRLDTIEAVLEEGFEFVAMARALLREPDSCDVRDGETDEGLCVHCNKCMPTIYSGTRCVLNVWDAGLARAAGPPCRRGGGVRHR